MQFTCGIRTVCRGFFRVRVKLISAANKFIIFCIRPCSLLKRNRKHAVLWMKNQVLACAPYYSFLVSNEAVTRGICLGGFSMLCTYITQEGNNQFALQPTNIRHPVSHSRHRHVPALPGSNRRGHPFRRDICMRRVVFLSFPPVARLHTTAQTHARGFVFFLFPFLKIYASFISFFPSLEKTTARNG